VGYVLTRLFGAVELPLEQLRFEDVVAELAAAQRPHTLELMRFDYQRNVLTGKWESLAQLRAAGRFLQDPRQEAMHFVDACKRGAYTALVNTVNTQYSSASGSCKNACSVSVLCYHTSHWCQRYVLSVQLRRASGSGHDVSTVLLTVVKTTTIVL
jgi:hypothetical protein